MRLTSQILLSVCLAMMLAGCPDPETGQDPCDELLLGRNYFVAAVMGGLEATGDGTYLIAGGNGITRWSQPEAAEFGAVQLNNRSIFAVPTPDDGAWVVGDYRSAFASDRRFIHYRRLDASGVEIVRRTNYEFDDRVDIYGAFGSPWGRLVIAYGLYRLDFSSGFRREIFVKSGLLKISRNGREIEDVPLENADRLLLREFTVKDDWTVVFAGSLVEPGSSTSSSTEKLVHVSYRPDFGDPWYSELDLPVTSPLVDVVSRGPNSLDYFVRAIYPNGSYPMVIWRQSEDNPDEYEQILLDAIGPGEIVKDICIDGNGNYALAVDREEITETSFTISSHLMLISPEGALIEDVELDTLDRSEISYVPCVERRKPNDLYARRIVPTPDGGFLVGAGQFFRRESYAGMGDTESISRMYLYEVSPDLKTVRSFPVGIALQTVEDNGPVWPL